MDRPRRPGTSVARELVLEGVRVALDLVGELARLLLGGGGGLVDLLAGGRGGLLGAALELLGLLAASVATGYAAIDVSGAARDLIAGRTTLPALVLMLCVLGRGQRTAAAADSVFAVPMEAVV